MTAARSLVIPVVAALLALALWNTFLVYPLKIFVVFLHEVSHGLAAVATGGEIVRIELSFDQGGVCLTRGGMRFAILSAGYLGSLLLGALLLIAGARSRHDRAIVGVIGFLTLLVTLVYVRSLFGFVYGVLASGLLIAAAAFLPAAFSDGFLKVMGTVSCLYAVWDISSDVLFRSVPGSDAHGLAEITGIPAVVWGALWIVVACGGAAFALVAASRRAP